jgi:hypothetical protein
LNFDRCQRFELVPQRPCLSNRIFPPVRQTRAISSSAATGSGNVHVESDETLVLKLWSGKGRASASATKKEASRTFISWGQRPQRRSSVFRKVDGDSKVENITYWALGEFNNKYVRGPRNNEASITKERIFYYVYGVLHDPVYREKYALNLKREFARIPFYKAFWQRADWGKELMDLHIGYESVAPPRSNESTFLTRKRVRPGFLQNVY